MSEVQVFTQKGEGKTSNEDRAVYGENWMAVFDGATQAEPPADGKDGGWYAEHLSQNVKRILDDQPDLELAQVVHDAIKQLVTDHPLDPDTAPSSTVAIARWREDSVDMYVLGDSFVVWETEDGERNELTDDRLQRVAVAEREAYRAIKADPSATQDEVRRSLAVLQRQERKWRNKPGGYWIASERCQASFEGLSMTLTGIRFIEFSCLTDGLTTNPRHVLNLGFEPSTKFDDGTAVLARRLLLNGNTEATWSKAAASILSDTNRALQALMQTAERLEVKPPPFSTSPVIHAHITSHLKELLTGKTTPPPTPQQMELFKELNKVPLRCQSNRTIYSAWIETSIALQNIRHLSSLQPKVGELIYIPDTNSGELSKRLISSIGKTGRLHLKGFGEGFCRPNECFRTELGELATFKRRG